VIDKRLTEEEKKKIKPANQGGGPNYLGKQETVTVPKKWLSDPDHVVAELAYITPREQKILLDANIYGSLKGKPNKGPGGIMSLQGDLGGYDASPGGPNDPGSGGGGNRVGDTDKNKQRAADIMTGRVNVSSPTGMTQGYTGPSPTGRNTGGDFFGQPSFLGNITSGIKDYITGGGLIGMGIRGLTGLVDKFTGPKATEYGNLNIPGYNMLNIAGPKEYDFGPKGGDGEDSNLYATTNQYPITGTIPEEGIISLLNSMPQDSFESRYLQSQPQDIREAIEASMQNYYT